MMEDRGDWIAVLLCGLFGVALIVRGINALASGRVQFRRYETGLDGGWPYVAFSVHCGIVLVSVAVYIVWSQKRK